MAKTMRLRLLIQDGVYFRHVDLIPFTLDIWRGAIHFFNRHFSSWIQRAPGN